MNKKLDKAGQEDRDNICDFEKCPTVNNYRIDLKQIEQLQARLKEAEGIIKEMAYGELGQSDKSFWVHELAKFLANKE